jgi:hypothetical protein
MIQMELLMIPVLRANFVKVAVIRSITLLLIFRQVIILVTILHLPFYIVKKDIALTIQIIGLVKEGLCLECV